MQVTFFESSKEFRKWLEKNHLKESELIVGFYKVSTQKASITWSESVDEALCFGWIDGVRRSIDTEAYCIRFTPRKKNSIWSAINIKKVENLRKSGRMTPEGDKAFSWRKEHRSMIYSHEQEPVPLLESYEKKFQEHIAAWHFFSSQAPSYQRVSIHWIMSAKQEKTRLTRLEKMIVASEEKRKLGWN